MADISEQNAKRAASFAQSATDVITKIFTSIAEYLEKEAEYASQRALADWIRKGGELYFYPVQGGCTAQLKYEMDKQNVPYAGIVGDKQVIIRAPDLEAVKELNRLILVRESNYFQDVDSRELENAIARHDGIRNKEIFSLHDLSKYQTEVLKNKCNQISSGFMVGIGKENDRYTVSIHSNKLYNTDAAQNDFCKAYLQMLLSLHGPNSETKIAQIDADEKIDLEVAGFKGKSDVHYIIGVDDPTRYIEINAHEFQFYETAVTENGYTERHIFQCSVDDPNYNSELQRYMDRIYNKAIISDSAELTRHLSTKDRTVESLRPKRNLEQYNISIANDKIADRINTMIKERIQNKHYSFENCSEQFKYYEREAAHILECCLSGKTPTNYRLEDVKEINKIFDKYVPSDLRSKYQSCIESVKDIKCESHRARALQKEKEKEVRKEYGFAER